MLPSHVTVGSISALALVISNFVPLPVSALTLIMNIALLAVSFFFLGSDFGFKSVYGAILLPAYIALFEILFPEFQSITQDPLLDVICYVLIVDIGLAILFSYNASSGGIEVIAKLMNKFLHIELGKSVAIAGIAVALTSALCYDAKTVVLSVLGTYFSGIVLDYFIFGMHIKRKVCILSTKNDEILHFILHVLHSGASLYEATGAYDKVTRTEIITIVDKHEYRKLMDFIRETDPVAFVTVYSVSDMRYQPKVISKDR
jgi:uncharacterized membrane-anchored protein YitT (DUF2179 family)